MEKPGPTGRFPDGKINDSDEGEIAMAIGVDIAAGRIFMDFGKAVKWVAMTPEQAEGFADLLKAKARQLREPRIEFSNRGPF